MDLEGINIPNHIAIIMDGNGRWAIKKGLPRSMGHRAGVDALRPIIRKCSDIGVKIVTVYAFSTENWKRPKAEVAFLMTILLEYMKKEIKELKANNIKIKVLGDITAIPQATRYEIEKAVDETKDNQGMQFNIALNYGGRTEILRAVKKAAQEVVDGKVEIDKIDENYFKQFLYTKNDIDPDLIIRTSGEKRLSNFLTWQTAYSELVFVDEYWPDFNEKCLMTAIKEYSGRDRRFGIVK